MVDDDWELDILRRLNSVRACVRACLRGPDLALM